MMEKRPDYDHLFTDRMVEHVIARPRFNAEPWIIQGLRQHGFFGFMRENRGRHMCDPYPVLKRVIAEIAIGNPALATTIVENEFATIGLRAVAMLAEDHDIHYELSTIFNRLESWVERLEAEQVKEQQEQNISSIESQDEISRNARIPRLVFDIIFKAGTSAEKALVTRLFDITRLDTHDYDALILCKESGKGALNALRLQYGGDNKQAVAERAIHLGLSGRLDPEKMQRYFNDEKYTNDIVAKFLVPELCEDAAIHLGRGLLFADVEERHALAMLHGHLFDFFHSRTTDAARSAWLTSLANGLRKDYVRYNEKFLINIETGGLLVRIIVQFAERDPTPFVALIKQLNEDDPLPKFQSALRRMIFDVCFSDPVRLKKSRMLGRYPEEKVRALVEQGIIGSRGNNYELAPVPPTKLPESIRRLYADVIVGCLCDSEFCTEQKIIPEQPIAQRIVDARILTRRHWRQISEHDEASAFMTKATLSPGILEVVGEKMREQSLSNALGL
ncbi:hypothetical protein DV532_28170 (plasmid) [Pseudomonas sp. Leaf58]|uniref:hypothetical protein n=1 Tax=Pseudomonas sp. Leaf58 TaxID=1736226 RepID=UPI0006F2FE31|nr:hypothetical protein [Pseudomonas sp. Leaf58]AYG48146.1 hypothetical protein DV532_28170 [Pseudomonas sp. Leaf58]KQN62301.1 hypothetical protein ASF02_09050 [Pseudomonas sp. Leaf58]